MVSVASEEENEEMRGCYSHSADVSVSESSSECADSKTFSFASESFVPPQFIFPVTDGEVWEDPKPQKLDTDFSDMEMMKQRFAKLLLGEDMSGGGRGVCAALAISNAITNISVPVFEQLGRLEPLESEKKTLWRREMEWLLSVSDQIVELVPSMQQDSSGGTFEVMEQRQRADLFVNLPALKKLDAMLITILDGFEKTEFWYVDRNMALDESDEYSSDWPPNREEEKWWLPCPKVPEKGLSEESRKKLQQCRESTQQIYKAALAINNNVLAEMEIPTAYLENLPKSGKECLGDTIYGYIADDHFSLACLDKFKFSSEHYTVDVANRLEAALHVWKLKESKEPKQKSWGVVTAVKGLGLGTAIKNRIYAKRAETLLQSLRLRFPDLPQTTLDTSKILYNKDVGHSILESYSRVMEKVAFNIMSRIDDVLYADDATKICAAAEEVSIIDRGRSRGFNGLPIQMKICPSPFSLQNTPLISPLGTPICSSPPMPNTPERSLSPLKQKKNDIVMPGDLHKLWAYASGNFGSKKHSATDYLKSDPMVPISR